MKSCLIFNIILLIVVFILLILFDKNKEKFQPYVGNVRFQNDSQNSLGHFSIVNTDDTDPEGYDVLKEGPKCVGMCVAEHGPNILFTNPSGSNDALEWNKNNPTKGFCYRVNSRSYPFECGDDCQNKCQKDDNDPTQNQGEYDPDIDFSQCVIDHEKGGCVENKLNAITGQSCMTTVGCKLCIEKYKTNLDQIKNVFFDEITENEKCESQSDETE